MSENERRVPAEELNRLTQAIFEHCGMSSEDAALLAHTLVEADLRGVHTHGVVAIPRYRRRLLGGVDPRGRPRVVVDAVSGLVIDGDNSMGQVAAAFAMSKGIERARTTNVAVVAVRGSNHCGAMAYYAMLALREDMIGIAITNTLPTMAPWGGIDRILGNNPVAIAIPADKERPIVLDVAFSAAFPLRVRMYLDKGLPIPNDWVLDAEGHPTTDPAIALNGVFQPIGKYKGTALALAMGILGSLLSGASYGTELGSLATGPKPGADGHFFLALKIAAFEDPARFKRRVDNIIREIHSSRQASGVKRIYLPGERAVETEAAYRRDGIPLTEATLSAIADTALEVGVDASAIR